MKNIRRTGIIILSMVLAIGLSLISVNANAATSKKKQVTPEEQQVIDLTAFRDALIKQGASESDIANANAAIAVAQATVDNIKAQAQALAEQQKMAEEAAKAQAKAAEEALKAQQAIMEQYYAALEAQQKGAGKAAKAAAAKAMGTILVGDSRFVQMHGAVGMSGATFIAENSKGYNWFVETAIPMIDARVGKGSKIVINLGVNDPGNADKYVSMVNLKAAQWIAKGAKVYYATVNPVSENPYTSEAAVQMMNDKLVSGLVGVGIIDTNTYLKTNGYRLVDGLHYDEGTYRNIYNYIMGSI